jgi:aquaporin Z
VELFHQVRPEERKPEDDPPQPNESYKIGSRLLSEFLGTYMLVLTVGLNVLGESKAPVWSIAASLMCMIFALGTVSGAHFNPAVTIAILFSGDETVQDDGRKVRAVLKTSDVYQYVSVQLIGGFLAAVTYCLMENNRTFPLQPGAGHTWLSAYLAEFIFTFLLAYVVLSVATVREAWCDQVFGLAIGSCITAGGYAIGTVSGGSLNPAVSFSIAMSSLGGGHGIFHVVPYILFEIAGGITAAVAFRITHQEQYSKRNIV